MSLVPLVALESAPDETQRQLVEIQAAFGTVPKMFGSVANSPAALSSMWASFGAYGDGILGAALSEQIAVAVANRNACEYCLAAHTALGKKAGVDAETLSAAQVGASNEPRIAALLAFALKLVDLRGQTSASDIQELRDHGWSDEHIVEVIGQVALNIFTNYVNIALAVPLDFPTVALRAG